MMALSLLKFRRFEKKYYIKIQIFFNKVLLEKDKKN